MSKRRKQKKLSASQEVLRFSLQRPGRTSGRSPDHEARVAPKQTVRPNVRLILTLLVICAMVVVASHFLHAYQVQRNADIFLRQADQAEEAGEFDDAITYLGRYVGFRPDDMDAHVRLGKLVYDGASTPREQVRAYRMLESVLRRAPEHAEASEIRRLLVDLLMTLGRWQDALAHLDVLLPKTPDDRSAEHGELALMAGQCHQAEGDYGQSVAMYLEAIRLDPARIAPYAHLADLIARSPDRIPLAAIASQFGLGSPQPDSADQADSGAVAEPTVVDPAALGDRVLEVMVERGQPQHESYLERAAVLMGRQAYDRANEDVQQAAKLAPDDARVLYTATSLALAQAHSAQQSGSPQLVEQFLQRARGFIERGLSLPSPDPRFFLLKSNVDVFAEDLEAAERHLREGLATVEKRLEHGQADAEPSDTADLERSAYDLRWALADVLISRSTIVTNARAEQQQSEAQELIGQLGESTLAPARVEFLEARMLFAQEQWYEASLRFEQIRPRLADTADLRKRTDLALGVCYQQLGNPGAQISVFRRALSDDPLWVPGRLGLARALAEVGRLDEAIGEYQTISGVPGVPLEVARLLVRRKLALPPARRNWADVRQALDAEDQLRERYGLPRQVATDLMRTELLLRDELLPAEQRFEQALERVEELQAVYPQEPAVWIALVHLELARPGTSAEQRVERAAEILDAARAALKDNSALTLEDRISLEVTEVTIAVRLPQEQALERLTLLEQKAAGLERQTGNALRVAVAAAYVGLGQIDSGRELYQQVAKDRPNDLGLRLALAELAARKDDVNALQQVLQQIRQIEGPGGPNGNYVQAALMLQKIVADSTARRDPAQLAAAVKEPRALLVAAGRKRQFWQVIPRLLGRLEALVENADAAYEHYRRAIALGDTTSESFTYAVRYLAERQRYDEADQLLDTLRSERPELLSGQLFTDAGARTLAGLAVQVAAELQMYDEALAYVPPGSTDYRDTVLRALLVFDKYQALSEQDRQGPLGEELLADAERLHREAIELSPEAPEPWIHLVVHLARVGKRERAAAVIDNALKRLPQKEGQITAGVCYQLLGDLEKAEQFYESAVALDPNDLDRRMAALRFYASTGQVDKVEQHVATVLDPRLNAPDHIKAIAHRLRALQLTANGGYRHLQQALGYLQKSRQRDGWTAADWRTQAAILANSDLAQDRRALISVYEQLQRMGEITPQERFSLARLYQRTGQIHQSLMLLRQLLVENPDNAIVLAQYAQVLIEAKQWQDADSAVSRLESLLPGTFGTMALRAQLLASRDPEDVDEAVRILEEALEAEESADPAAGLNSLLAQGRVEEAMAILESELAEQSSGDVADSLRQARQLLDEGESERAAELLQGVAGTGPLQRVVLRLKHLTAAKLFEQFGRLDRAEWAMRRFAERLGEPSALLNVVPYVAKQGRLGDALAICDEARSSASAKAVVTVAINALREGRPTAAQIQRVETWIEDGMKEDPDSLFLVAQMANLRDLQGNYDQSEALYRSILLKNSNAVLALNNLAWLLALRGRSLAEAEGMIDRAIKLSGPVSELLDTRGAVYLAKGDAQRAIADFEASVADEPDPVKLFHLALAHWRLGNRQESQRLLTQANEEGIDANDLHALERPLYHELMANEGQR